MNRSPRALALLAIWIALLAILGWFTQRELQLGADLRLFLPSPTTPEQRLLLEEVGEGPAARVLVVELSGSPPAELADVSRALVEELRDNPHFRFVTNGETALDALPEELLSYRYLLSPTLDSARLDADFLRAQIEARARDLASPAGALIEPLVARDPTLELLTVLQRWTPMSEPRREFDVWFDASGERALLLAETHAAAFDPDRQRLALTELRAAFARAGGDSGARLFVSGSGQFSVLMEERTRSDAQRLGALASLGMVVLLLIAYRRPGLVVLSALPLASAGLVGLAFVSALFGEVHGVTLAFGFTLIGVAQDYPIHLLSHRRADRAPADVARGLWPTLATGVASTCIAYFTFYFSGVVGLQQLACFTVAGLAGAALTTRFALPPLIDQGVDNRPPQLVDRIQRAFDRAPRPRWLAAALLALGLLVLALGKQPLWENDLSKLTPVPTELLERDQTLRAQLGTPDVRHLLVLEAPDEQQALARLEALDARLRGLVEEAAIAGYDHAARYVPTVEAQRRRQSRLADEATLRTALERAVADSPFKSDAFEPFIADVQRARSAPPLTIEALRKTGLGATLEGLLRAREGRVTALVTVSGVKDVAALHELAKSEPDLALLDLKAASESLVETQRERILRSLAAGALLLIIVVAIALRRFERVVRVLAPMALTTALVLAVLYALGVSLTLFHLIALILAAGLGLDYALFFEHAADDPDEQRATLHAILVCSLSTLMVFALLATSSLPVLQAIGATVSLGVIVNFALAMTITRRAANWLEARDWRLKARTRLSEPTAARPTSYSSPQPPAPSLASLIPHQGSMCLLERLVEWSDTHVVLESDTHRSRANPLRVDGRLRAVHLCEYGAQAMAVHGALRSQAAKAQAQPGMLASLRAVRLTRDFVEDLPGALRVEAECLQASDASLQYSFKVTHAGELLAEGRAAVVLQKKE